MIRAKRGEENRVLFWCPGCDETHVIVDGGPNGWTFNGDLEAPTFHPSVLTGGVQWDQEQYPVMAQRAARHPGVPVGQRTVCHSFVTGGRIQFLGDSTHVLAGQTVDLPEWPDHGPGTAG